MNTPPYNTLSGFAFGIGSVSLAYGIGKLAMLYTLSDDKYQTILAHNRIEQQDERNLLILSKSINSTSKAITYLLVATIALLAILNADKRIIIGLAILIITKTILIIAFTNYYSNKL